MKRQPGRVCSSLLILSLSLISLLPFPSVAQTSVQPRVDQPFRRQEVPRPTPTPQRSPATSGDEDDIVRITTNLVQLDVVVTDSKGNQVTNLTADDFEMFEDGRAQKITNFSFVSNESGGQAPLPVAVTTSRVTAETGRPVEHQRRTIVLVVDDLNMSFESAVYSRRGLRKFIEERMLPGDLIAIVRTSAGVGALQQLTSNKEQLYTAVERVRGGRQTLLEMVERCRNSSLTPVLDPTIDTPTERRPASEFDGFKEQSSFTGSLGAINFIVRGLRELPGRKALVLVSEGLVLCPEEQLKLGTLLEERLRKIADLANRASVVVYSVDPRGLIALDSAASAGSANTSRTLQRLSNASKIIFDSQRSFAPMVYATGGFPIYNNNDIPSALGRVADDQKGYYLIGYRPGDSSFDSKKGGLRFNNIKVKLKRSGLTVRTRSGFYGFTETKGRTVRRTRAEQLLGGLTSPFSSGAIDVRLTSLFGNEASGSFMLSMLHIDPAGLTFTTQADGWQQAVMDVLAIIFDADGQIVEQVNRTQTIRARGNTFQRLMKNGLVYSLSVPIKKPGAYQLRIAVRDAASERVGSASQFIEVPDLDKHRLALSGIAVRESKPPDAIGKSVDKPVVQPSSNNNVGEETYSEPQAGPARRRFHHQSVLDYDYVIYNATAGAGSPQLKTQVTVSRDGQEVLVGEQKSFDLGGQSDLARLKAAGRLLLGEALPPGEYVLKITVVDTLAKGQYTTATQWIDFEIVK